MANDQTKLPLFERGGILLASQLNAIVRAMVSRVVGGPGVLVRAINNQITIGIDPTFPITTTNVVMQVRSVAGDYLVCRRLHVDGSIGNTDLRILKPYELRRTPFDGVTVDSVSYNYTSDIRRTGNGDAYLITPNYWFGAQIVVTRQNLFEDAGGVSVNLVDSNQGARSWALEP